MATVAAIIDRITSLPREPDAVAAERCALCGSSTCSRMPFFQRALQRALDGASFGADRRERALAALHPDCSSMLETERLQLRDTRAKSRDAHRFTCRDANCPRCERAQRYHSGQDADLRKHACERVLVRLLAGPCRELDTSDGDVARWLDVPRGERVYASHVLDHVRAHVAHFERRGLAPPRLLLAGARSIESARSNDLVTRLAVALSVHFAPLSVPLATYATDVIAPQYPRARREIQARIALGERPAEILPGLTAREAHAALIAGVESAVKWILRDTPHRARDVPTARWIIACLTDAPRREALQRSRVERGPGGREIQGRLLDRIDEIRAEDLDLGPATGVEHAFERAAKRLFNAWSKENKDDSSQLAPVPAWWRPIRCARVLTTRAQLIEEHEAMHHCIVAYAPVIAARECVCVSICVRARGQIHRSTVEFSPEGHVVHQHRGPGNAQPHALCVAALSTIQKRIEARS